MLGFRKLDAYRYSVALLELASALADEVPRPQRRLADQLGRTALCVLRTLAEGSHRQHAAPAEARACYALARASAFECAGVLDALELARAIPGEDAVRGREVVTRVVAMLCRLEGEAGDALRAAAAGGDR
jgi:four helix bundle protein